MPKTKIICILGLASSKENVLIKMGVGMRIGGRTECKWKGV